MDKIENTSFFSGKRFLLLVVLTLIGRFTPTPADLLPVFHVSIPIRLRPIANVFSVFEFWLLFIWASATQVAVALNEISKISWKLFLSSFKKIPLYFCFYAPQWILLTLSLYLVRKLFEGRVQYSQIYIGTVLIACGLLLLVNLAFYFFCGFGRAMSVDNPRRFTFKAIFSLGRRELILGGILGTLWMLLYSVGAWSFSRQFSFLLRGDSAVFLLGVFSYSVIPIMDVALYMLFGTSQPSTPTITVAERREPAE